MDSFPDFLAKKPAINASKTPFTIIKGNIVDMGMPVKAKLMSGEKIPVITPTFQPNLYAPISTKK